MASLFFLINSSITSFFVKTFTLKKNTRRAASIAMSIAVVAGSLTFARSQGTCFCYDL